MRTGGEAGKRKTLWVTGGSGFLGSHLVAFLRDRYEVVFSYRRHELAVPRARGFNIDLTSKEEVARFLSGVRPEAIIHCAALTDIDYCESHFDEGWKVNVEASQILAEEAAREDIHFIFISTESVYGDRPGPHREEDPVNPLSRYAFTKWQAEEAVRKTSAKWFIARTGFEGWGLTGDASKLSFFEWVIRKFEERKKFNVFHDRIFNPFSIYNFIDILDEVVRTSLQGLYNVEGEESVSYLDFAKAAAGIFDYDPGWIVPAKMGDVLKNARRPHNTSLNVGRLKKVLKTRLLSVEEMLHQFREIRDTGQLALLRRKMTLRPSQETAV